MRSKPKIQELKVTPNILSLADSHFQLPEAPGTLKPIMNVSSTNIHQTRGTTRHKNTFRCGPSLQEFTVWANEDVCTGRRNT